MARHQRDTVQYFPHDTRASEGDTLTIIESNFGNDGYALWFKLLERLGSTDGHFIDCNNPIKRDLLFARAHITTEKGITIVEMLSELGAIDKQLWQHQIIWSQHFVDNVADVYENRRRAIPPKPIITNNNPLSTESNPITTVSNPQSILNELNDIKRNGIITSEISKKLSELLKTLILRNNANAKLPKSIDKWAREFDLMISHDNRAPEIIESVINWCQSDDFWKANILSPGKLREKFDQLFLKMNSNGHSNKVVSYPLPKVDPAAENKVEQTVAELEKLNEKLEVVG